MVRLNPRLITAPIMIVDDDVDDQYLMGKMLERIGVRSQILYFDNGRDALHYLVETKEPVFMILSDINMPVMNGLEFRNSIDSHEVLRKKSIPFIFYSTAARPRDVSAAYDLTVQGFFEKETDLASMESILELILVYWTKCKHPKTV